MELFQITSSSEIFAQWDKLLNVKSTYVIKLGTEEGYYYLLLL